MVDEGEINSSNKVSIGWKNDGFPKISIAHREGRILVGWRRIDKEREWVCQKLPDPTLGKGCIPYPKISHM
jgi:hypothetical protein